MRELKSFETLEESLSYANSIAKSGDSIILSPCSASYDQFDNYEQRGDIFREMVLKIWDI